MLRAAGHLGARFGSHHPPPVSFLRCCLIGAEWQRAHVHTQRCTHAPTANSHLCVRAGSCAGVMHFTAVQSADASSTTLHAKQARRSKRPPWSRSRSVIFTQTAVIQEHLLRGENEKAVDTLCELMDMFRFQSAYGKPLHIDPRVMSVAIRALFPYHPAEGLRLIRAAFHAAVGREEVKEEEEEEMDPSLQRRYLNEILDMWFEQFPESSTGEGMISTTKSKRPASEALSVVRMCLASKHVAAASLFLERMDRKFFLTEDGQECASRVATAHYKMDGPTYSDAMTYLKRMLDRDNFISEIHVWHAIEMAFKARNYPDFIFWSSQLHNDKAGQRPAAALAAKTLSLALPCVQSIEDSEVLRQIDELARIIASSVIFELHQPDKPAHINTKCIELIKWCGESKHRELVEFMKKKGRKAEIDDQIEAIGVLLYNGNKEEALKVFCDTLTRIREDSALVLDEYALTVGSRALICSHPSEALRLFRAALTGVMGSDEGKREEEGILGPLTEDLFRARDGNEFIPTTLNYRKLFVHMAKAQMTNRTLQRQYLNSIVDMWFEQHPESANPEKKQNSSKSRSSQPFDDILIAQKMCLASNHTDAAAILLSKMNREFFEEGEGRTCVSHVARMYYKNWRNDKGIYARAVQFLKNMREGNCGITSIHIWYAIDMAFHSRDLRSFEYWRSELAKENSRNQKDSVLAVEALNHALPILPLIENKHRKKKIGELAGKIVQEIRLGLLGADPPSNAARTHSLALINAINEELKQIPSEEGKGLDEEAKKPNSFWAFLGAGK